MPISCRINPEITKNYILLFTNYDDEFDVAVSIDYALIHSNGQTQFKNFKITNSKIDIPNFVNELNNIFLLKDNHIAVLAAFKSDMDYLSKELKKTLTPKPEVFINYVEIFEKDFSGLKSGEIEESTNLFKTLYILDEDTKMRKIKIISNY